MDLTGATALVTGAAKRVGRAIALELADAGCNLAIHFRRSEEAAQQLKEKIVKMGRLAVAIAGDLEDPASWPVIIEQTVQATGRLDILVNNASLFLTDAPDDLAHFDLGRWDSMLRVNAGAPVGLCRYAAPHLSAGGRGCVVNLCDISAGRPWPDNLAYCASKAALVSLTKALARALAPEIRVNGVAPGIAIFPDQYPPELRERLTARVPLARAGTPREIATAVRFLAETGDYITGQIINVDGGRSVI